MMKYQGVTLKRISSEIGKENGCVTVQRGQEQVLLNISASLVWSYIDGYMDADSILNNIKQLYQEDNSPEYICSVVEDSITLLLDEKLIERTGA